VKFKLDENLPASSAAKLTDAGHDVDTVAEEHPSGNAAHCGNCAATSSRTSGGSMSTWSAWTLRGLTSPVDPSDPSAVNRVTRPRVSSHRV
jgi:hypothetical protein